MGMPQLVVTAVLVEGRSKSEVARDYGLSRRWVITLVQRYLAQGEAGLAPRSRCPKSSPRRTPPSLEEEIVELRKELDRDGHDAGAATIADHLHRRHGTSPAVSTIWRILTARGFVTAQPHKRPKSSYIRFEAVQPNERWQVDITHWSLADGTDVEICNWLDDHSRYCLGSIAAPVFTAPTIDSLFRTLAAEHGDPAGVLSDNGAVFTGRYRGGGRVALEVTLHARGVVCSHCRPYHPQTCGKVERFHQTLKKWLARQPPATSPMSYKPSSAPSAPTTTTAGHTAPCTVAPRPRPTPPGPRPRPPASRSSTATSACATTRSTPTASSPCGTTAGSTTSASAAATPAHPSCSWSTTCTSACSAPADNCCAT
jgi:transposase InsO family protein